MILLNNVPVLSQPQNGGYIKTSKGYIRIAWEMKVSQIPPEIWEGGILYILIE